LQEMWTSREAVGLLTELWSETI